jgi:hypothetical protein
MGRLTRFAAMLPRKRRLLLRAFICVSAIRIGLWIMDFAAPRPRAKILRFREYSRGDCVNEIVWAVRTVSRYFPGASCLTQALAAQALLARSNHQSRIEIGVVKEGDRFAAHAWLMCDERIVLGGPDVTRYALLAAWEVNG